MVQQFFLNGQSYVIFEQTSVVEFNNYNKAINGTIYSERRSNVIFTATCWVLFNSNLVTQHGAAIYSFSSDSHVALKGISIVTFINNSVTSNDNILYTTWWNYVYVLKVMAIYLLK